MHFWVTSVPNLQPVTRFDLGSPVYAHAMSPLSTQHSLVVGTQYINIFRTDIIIIGASQEPAIRICDLRSGGFSHSITGAHRHYFLYFDSSLEGHVESVLNVKWSPSDDYLLASASADKTIRLWDIRSSGVGRQCLGLFDPFNDLISHVPNALQITHGHHVTSHTASVQGLAFTSDGQHLISSDCVGQIRMWDVFTMRQAEVQLFDDRC